MIITQNNLIYNSSVDIIGLIFFSLSIIGVAVVSIFASKWYIWGPKVKAKREIKKSEKRIKRDGGADLTSKEKILLKTKDEDLSSQDLLSKHKAENKRSKATDITERRKQNAIKDKQQRKDNKVKEKELLKTTKQDDKDTKKKQKELKSVNKNSPRKKTKK